MLWTEHRVETLLAHRAEKFSASLIAEKMGTTRNAILGKLFRLGQCEPCGKSYVPKRSKRSIGYPKKPIIRKETTMTKLMDAVTEETRELPADESPHAVSLLDAKDNQCRWPVNPQDGQFMFCGDVKVEPHSYCARHCLRAFNL